MIVPARAPVRPLARITGADLALPLDDEIGERLEAGTTGLIHLAGPPGSGKSVALAHLAALYPNEPHLLLVDSPDVTSIAECERAAADRLVVIAAESGRAMPATAIRWRMAPWTQDTLIEYLLAMHPDRCRSVMQRVLADAEQRDLQGSAELWRVVLDCLAADETLLNTRSALRAAMAQRLPTTEQQRAAGQYCLCAAWHRSGRAQQDLPNEEALDSAAQTLLRHIFPQTLLAAEHLAAALARGQARELLRRHLPEAVVQETARLIAADLPRMAPLHAIIGGSHREAQPMAASLLYAADPTWKSPRRAPLLTGAYLERVLWPEIHLTDLQVVMANLIEADLTDARIEGMNANDAELSGASLRGAHITRLTAQRALLIEANLSNLRAVQANFTAADLRRANCEAALLRGANLNLADLRQACFRRADLAWANLMNAQLEGADFSGADLSSAHLNGLTLRGADFAGARFDDAVLFRCDLEHMVLPGVRMERANLRGAYLTGTRMPNACLRRADLAGAGLAEIDWERSDLRDTDLRNCTFHMGSSRSGLVGSPIACEGSRTGFYTDELNEQDFKSPEEIRKANLRGADLRGARISNVDFYLVDVRDTKYTPDQETHLRRCGAILETRV